MSDPKWYFNLQRQVSDLMNQTLRPLLRSQAKEARQIIEPLIQRKMKKRTNMRPFLFYIGLCIGKGFKEPRQFSVKDKKLMGCLSSVLELENVSSYYMNHFLDNKDDIQDEQDEKNRVLAGLLCHNLAQELIISSPQLLPEEKLYGLNVIESIDHQINQAQIVDLNVLTFQNRHAFKTQESFEKIYFERCFNISGQFYGRCVELGMRLSEVPIPSNLIDRITGLYSRMSTLGQFGNDIGDIAPPDRHSGTLEKNYYKDFGSDFLNGRLTYPNFLLLGRCDERELTKLDNIRQEKFNKKNMNIFVSLLKKYEVHKDCLSLLRSKWLVERKELTLPPGELRTLISSSLIIFRSNKLIRAVQDLE